MALAEASLWNDCIRTIARRGLYREALQIFHQMHQQGVLGDRDTFVSTLTVCASLTDLSFGKQVHACMSQALEYETGVGNALVSLYGKCGQVNNALEIFDCMTQHDLISWSAIITIYAKQGHSTSALELFNRMLEESLPPNRVTFIGILTACANEDCLLQGKRAHARFENGNPKNDVILETALLTFYGKCGKLKDAQQVFDRMTYRDHVAWNAIIAAATNHKQGMLAFQLLEQLHLRGLAPDKVTFTSLIDVCISHRNETMGKLFHEYIIEKGYELDVILNTALVDMYGRCGSLQDARRVFDKMPSHNVVTWNVLIAVYSQHGLGAEALQLFNLMRKNGQNADTVTFISIFDACPSLIEGLHIHTCIVMQGLDMDPIIENALVNMYGKRNRLDDAQYVFNKMPNCNVISWTAMITTYTQEGNYRVALQVFDRMQEKKVQPDKIAFICGLATCTSLMALAEGKQMHAHLLDSGVDIDVDLGNALITMYAKCGAVATSNSLFDKMPTRDLISWNAVVTGFAQHGMGKEAVIFFERMLHAGLAPNKVTFVGVLTACSHAGLVDGGRCCYIRADEFRGMAFDVDLHDCMMDLLGRSGCFSESEVVVNETPFQPTALSYLVLLGACRHLSGTKQGQWLANHIHELDPDDPAPYVILSNIYVEAGQDDGNDATNLLYEMKGLYLEEQKDHCLLTESYGAMHGLQEEGSDCPNELSSIQDVEMNEETADLRGYLQCAGMT